MTSMPGIRERSVVRVSVTPSTKYSCSGSPPMLAKGSRTIERGGSPPVRRVGEAEGKCVERPIWPEPHSASDRIDPHWSRNVLQSLLAEIGELLL